MSNYILSACTRKYNCARPSAESAADASVLDEAVMHDCVHMCLPNFSRDDRRQCTRYAKNEVAATEANKEIPKQTRRYRYSHNLHCSRSQPDLKLEERMVVGSSRAAAVSVA